MLPRPCYGFIMRSFCCLFVGMAVVACSDSEPRPPGSVTDDSFLPRPDSAAVATHTVQISLSGTYEFVYPHNTPDLIENHYIVLEDGGGRLRGWYYGTSDDFDSAREGYLPGFFVAELEDLQIAGDSIRFTLAVPRTAYFTKPVPLQHRSAADIPADRLERWQVSPTADRREYSGSFAGDRIVLALERGERVFARMPLRR
jgi:hypothetical protein